MRPVNRRLRKTKNTAVHRDRGRMVQGRSGQGGQGPSHKPGLAPTPCQTAVCSGLPAPYDMHWTMQLRPTNCTISPCRVSPNRPKQQKTGTRMCAPPPPPFSADHKGSGTGRPPGAGKDTKTVAEKKTPRLLCHAQGSWETPGAARKGGGGDSGRK